MNPPTIFEIQLSPRPENQTIVARNISKNIIERHSKFIVPLNGSFITTSILPILPGILPHEDRL
jgi:hypothetical protein